MKQQNKMTK